MSPVKDQGGRPTCHLFATTALIEIHRLPAEGGFSEQALAQLGSGSDSGQMCQKARALTNASGLPALEHCPYRPEKRERSATGEMDSRAPLSALPYGFFHFGYFAGEHGDIVAACRRKVASGCPVAVSVAVVGEWWEEYAFTSGRRTNGARRHGLP